MVEKCELSRMDRLTVEDRDGLGRKSSRVRRVLNRGRAWDGEVAGALVEVSTRARLVPC